VAVAHVAVPGLVETEPARIEVETRSDLTRGRTVVDRELRAGATANAEVGVRVDRGRFIDLLVDAIAAVPDETAASRAS